MSQLSSAGDAKTDRAEFIRSGVRQRFGARTRQYAERATRREAQAELLIKKVGLQPGERVLDVATGPGSAALAAAAVVGPGADVVATDLVPEWAELVSEGCARAGLSNVTFRVMGAEALDLPDGSFDVALCKLGLMFVPDPVQALREMRRVLRDGGRLGVVVWSTADKVAHHNIARQALAPYFPPPPPEQRLPGPLELGEPGLIERHVAAAGFHDIQVDRQTQEYMFEDADEYWRQHVEPAPAGGPAALQALPGEQREQLHQQILAALEPYRRGGKIYLPCEAIYLTATR